MDCLHCRRVGSGQNVENQIEHWEVGGKMEFDIQQLIASVGIPGALCFYVMGTLRKAVDANTKALYLISSRLGVDINSVEGETTK
jgi:hypothetical protein